MTELEMAAVQAAPKPERKRTKKVFASLAAVSMVGVAGVAGTTAALSATTDNALNEFDAAYIELADNDAGSFMYDVENVEPGQFVERCIRLSYKGGKPADLKLAITSGDLGALAPQLDLTVESGSAVGDTFAGATSVTDPSNCGTFTATGAALYTGKLDAFEATHFNKATGLADPTRLATPASEVVYRVRVALPLGATVDSTNYLSGKHTYTWYADQA